MNVFLDKLGKEIIRLKNKYEIEEDSSYKEKLDGLKDRVKSNSVEEFNTLLSKDIEDYYFIMYFKRELDEIEKKIASSKKIIGKCKKELSKKDEKGKSVYKKVIESLKQYIYYLFREENKLVKLGGDNEIFGLLNGSDETEKIYIEYLFNEGNEVTKNGIKNGRKSITHIFPDISKEEKLEKLEEITKEKEKLRESREKMIKKDFEYFLENVIDYDGDYKSNLYELCKIFTGILFDFHEIYDELSEKNKTIADEFINDINKIKGGDTKAKMMRIHSFNKDIDNKIKRIKLSDKNDENTFRNLIKVYLNIRIFYIIGSEYFVFETKDIFDRINKIKIKFEKNERLKFIIKEYEKYTSFDIDNIFKEQEKYSNYEKIEFSENNIKYTYTDGTLLDYLNNVFNQTWLYQYYLFTLTKPNEEENELINKELKLLELGKYEAEKFIENQKSGRKSEFFNKFRYIPFFLIEFIGKQKFSIKFYNHRFLFKINY